jgi:beta-glucosidase
VKSLERFGFPDDFAWGVATSAQQIEGGRREGGRGDSVWDWYATQKGAIEDGSDPFTACDHFHRWRGDIELMQWLGVNAYRFSTSWSRVMRGGAGGPNAAGLDFYDSLVDGLLAAGIEPFLTLNHWGMPIELMEWGGWPSRRTVDAFVAYASAATERLGDRVRFWATHNEPWCIATLGYEEGCHAPGHRSPEEALAAAHHLLVSHGLAMDVIRSKVRDARAGIVLNLSPARPHSDTEEDREAARRFDGLFNRWYLDPIFRGEYPADAIEDRARRGHLRDGRLPFVEKGDMDIVSAPIDYLGVNYYSRTAVAAGPGGDPVGAPLVPREELTEMGWEVYPEGLTDILLRVAADYGPPEIYVTENGIALPEPREGDVLDDPERVSFLRRHVIAAHRALEQGVPLKGYFHWSLMDNFEWGHGYTKRFGLFRVNFDTCERAPKASARWYRRMIADNEIDDAKEGSGARSDTGGASDD